VSLSLALSALAVCACLLAFLLAVELRLSDAA
jgi:hypothetical protein